MREQIRDQFMKAWEAAKANVDPEKLVAGTAIRRWWPTIISTTPDWDLLASNLAEFPFNPYMCILTTFYFGYAQAIEDITEEKVYPAQEGGLPRVPEWLEELVMEDLVRRYADRH